MRVVTSKAAFLILAWLASAPATAGPALLFDASDGKVLYAEDIDNQWHPASLTKMMTAYLTFEAIKKGRLRLDQAIACSERAYSQPPSKVGLPAGGTLTVEAALQALIVKSANDVAVMLAEAVSGNEAQFVADMNTAARRLGMARTQFVNPNGLPAPEQVTTARDLARLARAIVKDYPEYAHYWAMPMMQLGKLKLRSHNGLLKSFEGADGMKTGFICDSGYNVVASATREGRKLIAVVLGEQSGSSRTIRAGGLLEHGFQQFGWKSLFNSDTIDNLPVAADAKSIVSMRDQVTAWDCGGRRKAVAASKAKSKAEAAAADGKKPAPQAAAAAAGVPQVGAKAEAKPKTNAPAAKTGTVEPAQKKSASQQAAAEAATQSQSAKAAGGAGQAGGQGGAEAAGQAAGQQSAKSPAAKAAGKTGDQRGAASGSAQSNTHLKPAGADGRAKPISGQSPAETGSTAKAAVPAEVVPDTQNSNAE